MNKQEEREFDEFLMESDWTSDMSVPARGRIKILISNLTKKREIKLIEEVEREIEAVKLAVQKTGTFKYDSAYDDCLNILKKLKGQN